MHGGGAASTTVVLTVDEATVLLGLLDLVRAEGAVPSPIEPLWTSARLRLGERVRRVTASAADPDGNARARCEDRIRAEFIRLRRQVDALRAELTATERRAVELKRDNADLRAVAHAALQLVGRTGSLDAIAADDDRLVHLRDALSRVR